MCNARKSGSARADAGCKLRRLLHSIFELSKVDRDDGAGTFDGPISVWAGLVVLMISAGITCSTLVILFDADFAIGIGQAAFIFSSSQVMAFVAGSFADSLAQKHGYRAVVGGGLAILGAGLLGVAVAHTYGELLVSYGMAVGLGSGAVYVPLVRLVRRWFREHRGRASRLAIAGVCIGTLAFPILAARVADAFGWRPLHVGLAALCLLMALLSVLAADAESAV